MKPATISLRLRTVVSTLELLPTVDGYVLAAVEDRRQRKHDRHEGRLQYTTFTWCSTKKAVSAGYISLALDFLRPALRCSRHGGAWLTLSADNYIPRFGLEGSGPDGIKSAWEQGANMCVHVLTNETSRKINTDSS